MFASHGSCSRLIKDKQPISCQSEHRCFNLNCTEITLRQTGKPRLCVLVRMQTRGWRSVGCSPGSPDCLRNGSVCRQNPVSAGSEVGHRQSAVYRDDQHAGARLSIGNCRKITYSGRHVMLLKEQFTEMALWVRPLSVRSADNAFQSL